MLDLLRPRRREPRPVVGFAPDFWTPREMLRVGHEGQRERAIGRAAFPEGNATRELLLSLFFQR